MRLFLVLSALLLTSDYPEILGSVETVLTQKMLDSAKGSFIVNKDYNLAGQTLVIPDGLTMLFSGGRLNNGELRGTNSRLIVSSREPIFGFDIIISGTWLVPEVHDGWFAFDKSPEFVSNQLINNLLAFSNDDTFCHILFEEDRIYNFELSYKGRTDIGNMVSFRIVDGEKKRNYGEIYNDKYSFLRIFTIPSNTHVTIKNTLKMMPTSVGAYFVFWEYGKENVTIDGDGIIAGDNDRHSYDTPFAGKYYYGEWGHIFKCIRCHNFIFRDITISDAFGDCLIYSGSYYAEEQESRWASGLTMENVKILRARRNGVAVGARNVRILNCHFEDCGVDSVKGTPPRSAIDFEPDKVKAYPEIGNEDVLMENCTFKNNHFDVASYRNNLNEYGRIATVIKKCRFSAPLKIQSTYWMRFENCYIPFVYNTKDSRSVMLYSRHMEFVDCEFGEYDTSILGGTSKLLNKYINCKFNTASKKKSH